MKRELAFLLAVLMLLCLAGCGKSNSGSTVDFSGLQAKETPGAAVGGGSESAAATETEGQENTEMPDTGKETETAEPDLSESVDGNSGTDEIDFSNLPFTNDTAEYLSDGRLKLRSNGVELIFTVPNGWLILTQDAIGQMEDYTYYVNDPAGFVALLQEYEQSAYIENSCGEEIDLYILQDGFSVYIEDADKIESSDTDQLLAELKEDNPDASEIYFIYIGSRIFIVYVYESEGYLIISTVINSISVDFYYSPGENSTDDDIAELENFLAALEIRTY